MKERKRDFKFFLMVFYDLDYIDYCLLDSCQQSALKDYYNEVFGGVYFEPCD